jgi:carbon-monoxide dehydrogenase large subunit
VVVQVEVDARSGEFTLQRYILVHDCGTQVNPMIVEGQVQGAVAQGIAAALFEELVYDRETGQLVNGTMVDYFMPTAADLPAFELDHLETPSPVTPFGIKGVGEGGTIAPPPPSRMPSATRWRRSAWSWTVLPVTAESIWRALAAARAKG